MWTPSHPSLQVLHPRSSSSFITPSCCTTIYPLRGFPPCFAAMFRRLIYQCFALRMADCASLANGASRPDHALLKEARSLSLQFDPTGIISYLCRKVLSDGLRTPIDSTVKTVIQPRYHFKGKYHRSCSPRRSHKVFLASTMRLFFGCLLSALSIRGLLRSAEFML